MAGTGATSPDLRGGRPGRVGHHPAQERPVAAVRQQQQHLPGLAGWWPEGGRYGGSATRASAGSAPRRVIATGNVKLPPAVPGGLQNRVETTGRRRDMTDTIEITVRLVGGPPDWAGKIVSAGPGSTRTMPVSDCTPSRDVADDPAPRAVYGPDPDHPNSGEWHFQAWFRATSYAPRPVDYLALPHEVVAAALAAADLSLPDSVAQQITVGLVDTITPVEELAATPREELVQELAETIVRVADDHLRTVPPAAAAAAARR